MATKYKVHNHQSAHFLTYTIVDWIDVLTRPIYKDIVVESLRFCIDQKGLNLFAWVIMSNHVHLIASAKEGFKLSDIIRDHKKFTSKRIFEAVQDNVQESRKNWLIYMFEREGKWNFNNENFQIWANDYHPVELSTNEMIDQRLNYLHDNPVKQKIVELPHHYLYSSAIDYCDGKGMLPVIKI